MQKRTNVLRVFIPLVFAVYIWQYLTFADPRILRDILWIIAFTRDRRERKG